MFKIKIAKAGKSVTSNRPEDFHLNSEYSVAKIGDEQITGPTTDPFTVAPGLGPDIICFGYATDDDLNWSIISQTGLADMQAILSGDTYQVLPQAPGEIICHCYSLIDSFLDATDSAADFGGFSIRISKDGVDVNSASNRDRIYDSRWPALKIAKQGTGIADGSGHAVIPHKLDFIPAFFVYDNNNWKGGDAYSINQTSTIDSTNLTINTVPGAKYSYVIFYNSLSGQSNLKPPAPLFMAISAPKTDVEKATLTQLQFLTGLGTMQIWNKTPLEIDLDNPNDDVWLEGQIAHGFDFIPMWFGRVTAFSDQATFSSTPNYQFDITGKLIDIECCADSANIYMRVKPESGMFKPVGAAATGYFWVYEKLA